MQGAAWAFGLGLGLGLAGGQVGWLLKGKQRGRKKVQSKGRPESKKERAFWPDRGLSPTRSAFPVGWEVCEQEAGAGTWHLRFRFSGRPSTHVYTSDQIERAGLAGAATGH